MICCSHGRSEVEDFPDCDRAYYRHSIPMVECDRLVHVCRLWHILICTPGTCWDHESEEQDDER